MKKISVLSSASIALTLVCAAFIYLEMPVFAATSGLLAYFTGMFGVKNESARWQIIVFVLAALIFGYAMCPKGGYACMLALMTFLSMITAIRLFFFSSIGHTKLPLMEPLFFILALAYYVVGNIFDGSGWLSWTFPAPSMAVSAFMIYGAASDHKAFKANSIDKYGADVGHPAPAISLPDQDGNMTNLSDYKSMRHVLLIFVRGDWCPTCHIMLRTYEKNREKFAEKNIMVMAIGPDPVGVNKDMVLRLGLDYKILSDDKQEAVKAYGMQLHENYPMTKYEEGIPLPAAFLVDMNGEIVYTSNPKVVGEILNPATIFPVIDRLEAVA